MNKREQTTIMDVEYGLVARAFDVMGDQVLAEEYWGKCIAASQSISVTSG
jgi:hypothetical protein